jgi:N-acylneuraminate cytidylyltransferase
VTNIAIIPARGGSQRIPDKNIREFCGKPMIAWSIEEALASACFDHVLVSTDSPAISAVAKSLGAIVPFERPAALSGDHVATAPVVRHALDWFRRSLGEVSAACCIYATAPLMDRADLVRGLELIEGNDCDFAFSVARYASPIQRALRLGADGHVQVLHPEFSQVRTQDLEPSYHDAGQFYWGRAQAWLCDAPIFGPRSLAVIVPACRVQDIDTPEDWDSAEVAFRIQREANPKQFKPKGNNSA